MAKFKPQKTELYGVFRIIASKDGIARVLIAAFGNYHDAEDWAEEYSKDHFDCDMALDNIDATIRAWDGTVSSMTLLK